MEKGSAARAGGIGNAILIAGPTASGKSALALDLAAKVGGAIINADSMQVYAGLRVLTARPDDADLARAPHHLYGHVDPAEDYSTGAWLRDVKSLLESGALEGKRPIFVGGTGLYFRALTEGLSEMPEVPRNIRDRWRYHLMEDGVDRLYKVLLERDPQAAARLGKTDGQRILRALEVLDASGRSILDWQATRDTPLVDLSTARAAVIEVPRDVLVRRIEERFDRMVSAGALEETASLLKRNLSPAKPAMKAIGVPEFRDVIEGRVSLEEGVRRAKIATRQYSKRQATWFRNQLGEQWTRYDPSHSDL